MLILSYNCYTPHLSHLGQTILHGTNCMIPLLFPSIYFDSSPEVSCLQEIQQKVGQEVVLVLLVRDEPEVNSLQSDHQAAIEQQLELLVLLVVLVIELHMHNQLLDKHCRSTNFQRQF